ncbi:MAG: amino acid adenylation domain-containing protein [Desulfobacterales bacterium]|jgi:amino acid adenylation domain-containing protein
MEDNTIYKVVVNPQEQYSIWPANRKNPYGWDDTGKSGEKYECLAYIKDVWTDMRPLSLRKQIDNRAQDFYGTYPNYQFDKCVHHLFEEQALRTPEAAAIVFEEQHINYAELNCRANKVAHYLQSMGVMPEIKIGLSIERSIEMIVGLLGILKSGGVYVPLDPVYPQSRLQTVIQNSRIHVLLTQDNLLERNLNTISNIVLIDKNWPIISKQQKKNTANNLSAENLSHVIYTSGSTGTPKGAMVAHGSLFNNVQSLSDRLGISSDDVYLQTASIAFTSSLRQLLVPLSVGATVVLATAEQRKDPLAIFDLIKKYDVTILDTVATFWENLTHALTHMGTGLKNHYLVNKLRLILSSGGELPSRVPIQWRTHFDQNTCLVNMYGQTETIGNILVYQIPGQHNLKTEIVPLGPPLDNIDVYLMDELMNPVEEGSEGEICIGGPNIARGYINQPEMTAEKFVPNPFDNTPGSRLYRSGDRGRRLPDSTIEFIGRVDFQINIRGFRIEPNEIETVIKRHPDVLEAVAVARDDSNGGKRLVAYVVSGREKKPTIEALRGLLNTNLPDYMVPSVFVILDALPRLPNGKYVPPRNELQQYLANLWCDTLMLDRVGIYDLFFELGGTSILAAQFVNKLQAELGEFVYIVSVFEAPTIKEYAEFLKNNYAHAVAGKFADESVFERAENADRRNDALTSQIDHTTILQMKQYIPSVRESSYKDDAAQAKNPPALFILSPPRSGAMLLRIMLSGHPKLFVTNDLQMLGFYTLRERKAALSGSYDSMLEETFKTVQAAMRCNMGEAKRLIEEYECAGTTTKTFYENLQQRLGEKILVEISSTYALDFETLLKAEKDFRDACYIHFISHPCSMIRSFQGSHMEKRLHLHKHPFNSKDLAELLWVIGHMNLKEFFGKLPEQRKYQMHYEDLISRPQEITAALCQRFGLEFLPDLLEPLEYSQADSMKTSTAEPLFNKNFNSTDVIAGTSPADALRLPIVKTDYLSAITWQMAEAFGYSHKTVKPIKSGDENPPKISKNPNRRKEFIARQRQRRVFHRKRRIQEGKTV